MQWLWFNTVTALQNLVLRLVSVHYDISDTCQGYHCYERNTGCPLSALPCLCVSFTKVCLDIVAEAIGSMYKIY